MTILNRILNEINESSSQFSDLAAKDNCTTRIINGWRVIDNCVECSDTINSATDKIFEELNIEKLLSDIRRDLYQRYQIDSNYDISDMGHTYRIIFNDPNKTAKIASKLIKEVLTKYSKKASEFCSQPHGGEILQVEDNVWMTPPTQISYGKDRKGQVDASWSVVYGSIEILNEQMIVKIWKENSGVYNLTQFLRDQWDLPSFI